MTTAEKVLALVEQGVPRLAIAERLGLTRQRIYQISHVGDRTPERQALVDRARTMLASGMPIKDVAAAIGCNRKTLSRWGLRALPKEPRHGTAMAYEHHGCRCDACREATTVRHRGWKAASNPADAPHGTTSGYVNWGCRCPACKAAGSAANRAARLRRLERRK